VVAPLHRPAMHVQEAAAAAAGDGVICAGCSRIHYSATTTPRSSASRSASDLPQCSRWSSRGRQQVVHGRRQSLADSHGSDDLRTV